MFKLFYLTLLIAAVALCHGEDFQGYNAPEEDLLVEAGDLPPRTLVRFRRQLFGGFSSFPSGGYSQNLGYKDSLYSSDTKDVNAWGSFSQTATPNKWGSLSLNPGTFNGGADFITNRGSGLSGAFSYTDKLGGSGTATGKLNLHGSVNHNLDVFGSHTKNFDSKFNPVGHGSTTLGTNYQHSSGADLLFSKTQTPGLPNTYDYSATGPILGGRGSLGLTGKTIEKIGTQATVQGKVQLTENLGAFASHTKALDTKLNTLGSSSTIGGEYNHHNGLQVTASGTRTSGQPDSAKIGAGIPLYIGDGGSTKVMLNTETGLQQGHKPDHKIGLTVSTQLGAN